jgi:CheY-like chemotaxis protein
LTQVLFITADKTNLTDLSLGLETPEGAMHWASTGLQALEMIRTTPFDLVVTDEQLGDTSGLAFIKRLVKANPMINCAAVSSLSKADYHEASEGLGILMQLPVRPSKADGEALMAYLKKVQGFTAATGQ